MGVGAGGGGGVIQFQNPYKLFAVNEMQPCIFVITL